MNSYFVSLAIIFLLRPNFTISSDTCISSTTNEAQAAPLPPIDLRMPSTPLSLIENLTKSFEPSSSPNIYMDEYLRKEDENNENLFVLPPEIQDLEEQCSELAEDDECNTNTEFMLRRCPKSCLQNMHDVYFDLLSWATIGHYNEADIDCVDLYMIDVEEGNVEQGDEDCEAWAADGLCKSEEDKEFMLSRCSSSCMVCISPEDTEYEIGAPQELSNATLWKETLEVMIRTSHYMSNIVMDTRNDKYHSVRRDCHNKDPFCSEFAALGHCEPDHEFYAWTVMNCAPACQTCELLDFSIRCPIPEDAIDALKSNDDENGLNAMFERMVKERNFSQNQIDNGVEDLNYTSTIYSRPMKNNDKGVNADSVYGNVMDGPWVVRLDDLLTNEECDRLIEIGINQGYEVSTEVSTNRDGTQSDDEVSDRRTSMGTFCATCYEDKIAKRVLKKISLITGFPMENSEDLQLLRYEPGQYYKRHHDYISSHKFGPSGPRVLTVLLYLNDVEEGGGTRFNELGEGAEPVDVQPKKGSALVWPSILHENVLDQDWRTDHEALPVLKGFKYAANSWLHLRDEQNTNSDLCG